MACQRISFHILYSGIKQSEQCLTVREREAETGKLEAERGRDWREQEGKRQRLRGGRGGARGYWELGVGESGCRKAVGEISGWGRGQGGDLPHSQPLRSLL